MTHKHSIQIYKTNSENKRSLRLFDAEMKKIQTQQKENLNQLQCSTVNQIETKRHKTVEHSLVVPQIFFPFSYQIPFHHIFKLKPQLKLCIAFGTTSSRN